MFYFRVKFFKEYAKNKKSSYADFSNISNDL
jgi:hypothetical protein